MLVLIFVVLLLNLTIGGIASDYSLEVYFGHDIHFLGDMLLGLVGGQVIVPAALIALVLTLFGVTTPLF